MLFRVILFPKDNFRNGVMIMTNIKFGVPGGTTSVDKNNGINGKFYRKVAILMYTEISGLKAEKQLRNKNRTKDLALGCHPRDNGHATH